jgi:WD40 repeat protein
MVAPGAIESMTIEPTGRWAVAALETTGGGTELALFDVRRQVFVRTIGLPEGSSPSGVAFLPDGSLVVCDAGTLTVLDRTTYQRVSARALSASSLGTPHGDTCNIALSRDGRTLAVSVEDTGLLRAIHLAPPVTASPAIPATVPEEATPAVSPDGRLVALAMFDAGVQQWDATTGAPAGRAVMQPVREDIRLPTPSAVAYSPDGRLLLVGDTRGAVQFLTVDGLKPSGLLPLDVDGEVSQIVFSADGTRLAVATGSGNVQIFDAETHRAITPLMFGQGKWIFGLVFSPSGSTVLAASGDGTVAIYDAEGRPAGNTVLADGEPDSLRTVIEVAASPDGRLVATTHLDGAVRVWDLDTGRRVDPGLHVPVGPAVGVAFRPDSKRLVAGDVEGQFVAWNVETWKPVGPPITVPGRGLLVRLAFTPDGRILAAGRETPPTIGFYDAETLDQLGPYVRSSWGFEVGNTRLRGLALSRDGTRLLTVEQADRLVEVWKVATGQKLQTLEDLDRVAMAATFNPAGNRVAVAEAGGGIELFDLRTERPVAEPLRGFQRDAIDVVYSPDGTMIAATAFDGTARIWDAETGLPIGPQLQFTSAAILVETSLTFTPDSKSLVTSGPLGAAIVWDLDADRLVDRVCQLAGRNLTRSEWDRYMPSGTEYRKTCPEWSAAPSE